MKDTNQGQPAQDHIKTDEAWDRMLARLEQEPVNPVWKDWQEAGPERSDASAGSVQRGQGDTRTGDGIEAVSGEAADTGAAAQSASAVSGRASRRTAGRRRKWGIAAAAVVLIGTVLATPVGNTAMASILNKFKMQEVTVVKENELVNIFNMMGEGGTVQETMNQFGTYSSSQGVLEGEYSAPEAAAKLGYPLVGQSLWKENTKVYIAPSSSLTLNMNVEAVNKVMKRLGATKLMPESIDGKKITLKVPETINYTLGDSNETWGSISQMDTPTVEVDPGVNVEEAVNAVIDFPLLPSNLRDGLKESRVLSGEIPMPLITDDNAEQTEINGTTVLVTVHDYSEQTSYEATWVKNGQLYNLYGGNIIKSKDELIRTAGELIQ